MTANEIKNLLKQYQPLANRMTYLEEIINNYNNRENNKAKTEIIQYNRAVTEYDYLLNQVEKIINLIDDIDNLLNKTIVEKYYIQGEKVEAIASDLDRTDRWVYKSITKAINEIARKRTDD